MFHKKTLSIAFISLLVLVSSCSFEEVITPNERLEKLRLIDVYYNLTNPDIKASVTVANVQGNFSADLWDENNRASALCINGSSICENEHIVIGSHEIPLNVEGGFRENRAPKYKSLFGKDVGIELVREGGVESRDQVTDMYVPQVLQVSLPDAVPVLADGYSISWNADELNDNGVYIVLHYSPHENPDNTHGYTRSQYGYVHVPDNGNYIFQKQDFENIPGGNSIVRLTVLRGNFDLPTLEGEQLRILAYSEVYGYARVQ